MKNVKWYWYVIGLAFIAMIGQQIFFNIERARMEKRLTKVIQEERKDLKNELKGIKEEYNKSKETLNGIITEREESLSQRQKELSKAYYRNNQLNNILENYEKNSTYDTLTFYDAAIHMSNYKYRPSE